jgi:hypothetical protein
MFSPEEGENEKAPFFRGLGELNYTGSKTFTLPLLVNAIEQGKTSSIFHAEGEKPDVTNYVTKLKRNSPRSQLLQL